MFRKIHSNHKPEDTLWSSLGAEYSVYLGKSRAWFKMILTVYPNQVFAIMVLLLTGSVLFMLTASWGAKPKSLVAATKPVTPSLQAGLSQILNHADAIRENLKLKDEIQLLIAKDSLTRADSIHLGKAINRLHQLTIKSSNHVPH